jgi:hypothetical protein
VRAHGASEQIKQDDNAILIAQFDEPADHVFKGTLGHSYQIAYS